MNEELNVYDIEVGHNAKGFWYCNRIKVTDSTEVTIVNTIYSLMKQMDEKCNELNKRPEPDKQGTN